MRQARSESLELGYTAAVADLVFLALVVAFFAVAVLAVRAAELLLGSGTSAEGGGES